MTSSPNSNPLERRSVLRETVANDSLPDTVEELDVSIRNMEARLANLMTLQRHADEVSEGVNNEVDIEQIVPQSLNTIELLQASLDKARARRAELASMRSSN